MEIRILRHVVVLARHLSYTKAAEELGLSQPALSRSIQLTEARARVRLFDRDRGGVHLTPVGRAFVKRAAGLVREADDLDRMLERASGGDQGEVAFGMAPLPAAALLPEILTHSVAEMPGLRRQIAVRNAEGLLPLLMAETLEFFVCAEGQVPETAPTKAVSLGWFPVSLLVRADHPLLTAEESPLEARYPLIVAAQFGETPGRREEGAPYLDGAPHLVLEDYGVLAKFTRTSDAIWLSSAFAVADEIEEGQLAVLPRLKEGSPARFRMMMYSLDRRSLSPAALQLKDWFRARIRRLSAELPT